ncbi:MAG: hypothetical protein ABF917_06210 [Gluconobacter oxydans]|uniref:hypothetical protein n=1 Tax=Gluconobacter oxydans TaxID=442 RepID=UPI0039ED65DD
MFRLLTSQLSEAISQDTGSFPRTYRVNLQAVAAGGIRLAAVVVCHYCPQAEVAVDCRHYPFPAVVCDQIRQEVARICDVILHPHPAHLARYRCTTELLC